MRIPLVISSVPIEITDSINMYDMYISNTIALNPELYCPSTITIFDNHVMYIKDFPIVGIKEYLNRTLPKHLEIIKTKYVLSIKGDTVEEICKLIKEINKVKNLIYGIEYKVSKNDLLNVNTLILKLNTLSGSLNIPFISVKLLPQTDNDIVSKIDKYTDIGYIHCFSGIPLETIIPNQRGYLSGQSLKYIYQNRVSDLYVKFPNLKIIATGGVSNYEDILDYQNKGACMVGVGSYLLKHPVNILDIVNSYSLFTKLDLI